MDNALKPIFYALRNLRKSTQKITLVELFNSDSKRFDRFSCQALDLLFDFSKTHINYETLQLLLMLCKEAKVKKHIEAMFRGDKINHTENRAVLHTALRNRSNKNIIVDGIDIMPKIQSVLKNMQVFSNGIRAGTILSATKNRFSDIVNIGIGGSNLGPQMVTEALESYSNDINIHFVSNVDSADLDKVLKTLNPHTTLFIISSKTFTTTETMLNAKNAYKWIHQAIGTNKVSDHFVAISADKHKVKSFEVREIFESWDFIGGRYSIWGAIGLIAMIAIGYEKFCEFLQGAYEMDEHFSNADYSDNMPILLALVGVWHRNICNLSTRAILPYEQKLIRLPKYIQQLEMESNGKSVNSLGKEIIEDSSAIIWGEVGTNGQHSFYQLLHQGTTIVPCEFMIGSLNTDGKLTKEHRVLVANCLAQSQALMIGRDKKNVANKLIAKGWSEQEALSLAPYRSFKGNRPSTTLLYKQLDPKTLGKIIALYEHRVFTESIIWDINPFDQWGVELGKDLANDILQLIEQKEINDNQDGSTKGLLQQLFSTLNS